MDNEKKNRMWQLVTSIVGLVFCTLVILNTWVLETMPDYLKVIAVLVGVCFLVLQIRQIAVTLKKKKD